ncbi:MAG: hypothetical protein NTU41_10060, partial [Chloroflexi bacterium]|nr:hypothetical protein [Chloroflexota bacterium]
MRERYGDKTSKAKSAAKRQSLVGRLWRRRPRISNNVWVLFFILSLLGTSIWVLSPSGSVSLGRLTPTPEIALALAPKADQTLTADQVQDKLTALGFDNTVASVLTLADGTFLVRTAESGKSDVDENADQSTLTTGLSEIGEVGDVAQVAIAAILAPKSGQTLSEQNVKDAMTASGYGSSEKLILALDGGSYYVSAVNAGTTQDEKRVERDKIKAALAAIGDVKEFSVVSAEGDLGLRMGLDLKGGVHLVYQAQFDESWSDSEKAFHMDRAILTIQNRIDKYGVAEPVIQKQGSDRILIQLPGITDLSEAKSLIEETGFLEFREIEMNSTTSAAATLSDYVGGSMTGFFDTSVVGKRIFARTSTDTTTGEETTVTFPYVLEKTDSGVGFVDKNGNAVTVDASSLTTAEKALYCWMPSMGTITVDSADKSVQLTGSYLSKALPYYPQSTDTDQSFRVSITWNDQGTTLFNEITQRIKAKGSYGTIQRSLGIFLDGEIISSPQVFPTTMTETSYGSN